MLKRFISVIFFLLPLLAQAEDFVLGKDYELISAAAETNPSSQIAVTEFFSYGCHWCYGIEPALMSWVNQQGRSIQFSRVPVVFNKNWTYFAKAYYAAHLLNLESKLNPLLFKTIQDKGQAMESHQAMINFFTAQGVDPATAKSAFEHSTTLDMKLNEGMALMARYHIKAVPALVVNHRYKTDLQMAKTEERLFKILDYLIAKSKSAAK